MRRRHPFGGLLAGLLGGVVGSVVGCNVIVGAGDYSVGDAGVMHADTGPSDAGPHDASKDGLETVDAPFDSEPLTEASSGEGGMEDPCSTDAGCAEGICNGAWCQTSCTSLKDTSCGTNSLGETNYCLGPFGDAGYYDCFPGCKTNADCTPYSITIGTTCDPVPGSPDYTCSVPNGYVGDPCSSTTDLWSNQSPCLDGGPDGGAAETCNGSWCTTSCSGATDTSCGVSSAGQSNVCVSTADEDGGYTCFPGCKSYADCAPYPDTFCELTFIGHDGPICARSGGAIGDPCTINSDCKSPGTCLGSWCSEPCASSTECGTNSEGMTNYCLSDSDLNAKRCFPGCDPTHVNADCVPYPPSKVLKTSPVCDTTSTGSVCAFVSQ